MLPLYPMMVYLAVHVFVEYRSREAPGGGIVGIATCTLLVLSIVVQAEGVKELYLTMQARETERDAVAALEPETVITNGPYLGSHLTSLADVKEFFYVRDSDDLVSLLPTLAERGITEFAFIPLEQRPLYVPDTISSNGMSYDVTNTTPFVYRIERVEH
jgi:hypothetical protein